MVLTGNVAGVAGDVFVLPKPIEARVLRLQIEAFVKEPCARLELFGCRKTNCIGLDQKLDTL